MWDEKYNCADYIYGTMPNTFLQQQFSRIPAGEVLCLAEGEGRNAVFLAKQGYQVSAVDGSGVGLKKAAQLAQANKVSIECIHADLEGFDMGENRWQGIVSIFCHIPLPARQALHKNVATALQDKGVFLLEAYTPAQLQHGTGGPPTAGLMMTAALLRAELKGLHFSHLQELEREVVEGTFHSGTGAVVQAIASKRISQDEQLV